MSELLPPPAELGALPAQLTPVLAPAVESVRPPGDEEPAEPGERHESLLRWARSRLTAKGILGNVALEAMRGHNARMNRPPLEDAEVVRLWRHLQGSRIAEDERALDALATAAGAQKSQPSSNGHVARLRRMDTITLRPVTWAWPLRVALGKLNVLAGLPGQGKSQLTCYLAAAVSRGTLPGDLFGTPADVVLVSAEDDPEDTIGPRLLAAGADLSRVHILDVRRQDFGREYTSTVRLPDDTPAVLEAVEKSAARLLILDPVSGLLAMTHSAYKSQEVRNGLDPIRTMAAERRSAVVLVSHLLTKVAAGTEALARLADSHAFAGLPRQVLYLTPHPDDEDGERGSRKLLTAAKGNLIPAGAHALELTVEAHVIHADDGEAIGTSRIVIGAEVDLTTADGLMGADERGERHAAERFLREQLAECEAWATDVQEAAKADGIAPKTLRNARERLTYHRKGISNRSIWGLKDMPKPAALVPAKYPSQEALT